MRWFKVSEGGRLLKAPSIMSSMRSAVRGLQVLVMVIAFGVGVGIEDNECALNQFRAVWPVGIADVIDEFESCTGVILSFPQNKSLGTPKFGQSQLRASLSAFQSPRRTMSYFRLCSGLVSLTVSRLSWRRRFAAGAHDRRGSIWKGLGCVDGRRT